MKTTYLWLFAFVVPLVLTSCSEGEFNDMDRQTFIDGCIVDLEQGRSRVSQLENIKALIDAYGPSALCQESWTLLVKEATEDSYANYRKLSIKQAVEVAVIFRSTAYRGQKLFEEEMQKALELSRQKKDTQWLYFATGHLKSKGIDKVGGIEEYPFGRFTWILDPDGVKIELWEPTEIVPGDEC